MISNVPIALFVYNRPDHLMQTLDGLRANHVPLIFAFSDGPKTPEQYSAVDTVRSILNQVDWCEMKIVHRDQNMGLGASIRLGISQVLEEYEQVIVVEDDIVLRPGAYMYTLAALERYKDSSVMTISMWSHPNLVPRGVQDGFFSKRFICWGWATYRSAWMTYQGTPLEVFHKCQKEKIDTLSWGKDLKWQAENAAERNLWYVGYVLTHFLENGVSYFPVESLTMNIGFDGSGQNAGNTPGLAEYVFDRNVDVPRQWPGVKIVSGTAKKFYNFFDLSKPLLIRGYLKIIKIIKRLLLK